MFRFKFILIIDSQYQGTVMSKHLSSNYSIKSDAVVLVFDQNI